MRKIKYDQLSNGSQEHKHSLLPQVQDKSIKNSLRFTPSWSPISLSAQGFTVLTEQKKREEEEKEEESGGWGKALLPRALGQRTGSRELEMSIH